MTTRSALLRLALLLPAGYVLAAGIAAFGAVTGPIAGLGRGDAAILGAMLAFPFYAAAITWGFVQTGTVAPAGRIALAGVALTTAAVYMPRMIG